MNNKHLTETQLDRYRQRRMNPAELLAADTHLARCEGCREAAALEAAGVASVESLRVELRSRESRPVHLPYDQLAAFIDGTLGDVEHEIVESHLAVCGECKADWLDLDLFRKSLSTPSKQSARLNPSSWWRSKVEFRFAGVSWTPVRAATAIACVVILVWVGSIPFRTGSGGSGQQTARSETPEPGAQAPREAGSQDGAGVIVELNDGGGTIALHSNGSMTGLSAAPPELRDAVKAVLGGRPLAVSEEVARFVGRAGVLLGGDQSRPRFGPLSPVGTAIVGDRPTLRWQRLAGARRYEVSVYDTNFARVAVSSPLSRTEWTLPRPLKGGAVYGWQVKAFTDDGEVLSPMPPEPEARFKVLDRKEADELLRVQRDQAESHLALGILFAGAGALDDAKREFTALAEANPQSPIPRRLLRELGAARR